MRFHLCADSSFLRQARAPEIVSVEIDYPVVNQYKQNGYDNRIDDIGDHRDILIGLYLHLYPDISCQIDLLKEVDNKCSQGNTYSTVKLYQPQAERDI